MKKIINVLLGNRARDSSFITNKPKLRKVTAFDKQFSFNEISQNILKSLNNGKQN